ncbi:YbgC/FadM family acyl-CoA thioesterase [Pseudoroseomonas cervicalis]|uniref:Putative tol-pal system-associated acyl-CoA thioesterase n=1 Tax=Pseudoroseomonas cervicalis ATCC 49957 TaxID=525371 RepID=D5RRA5_9PROT|nr:YbgC/FadM family acyl-CoA thioesterase [Pseudoroseomonas cervicalis]EFH10157.1 putative tol-pal system-associated acyl-CoA thioesterase [Pseudoroseomonas cervicalis ATCC 49957]
MSWPHRWPLRVYFEDTDAGGIAYHASYLRWAERGRTESLRAINLPHQVMIERHNSMLVVRRIEVEYVAPARLDDSLLVETAVRRFGGASVELAQDVRDEAGGVKARLRVGLVCVRAGDMRPVPVPGPWREAFRLAQAAGG